MQKHLITPSFNCQFSHWRDANYKCEEWYFTSKTIETMEVKGGTAKTSLAQNIAFIQDPWTLMVKIEVFSKSPDKFDFENVLDFIANKVSNRLERYKTSIDICDNHLRL